MFIKFGKKKKPQENIDKNEEIDKPPCFYKS